MAADAASLRTSIDSMSLTAMVAMELMVSPKLKILASSLVIGMPSITSRGSLPALIEEIPRMLIRSPEPRFPDPVVEITPATRILIQTS